MCGCDVTRTGRTVQLLSTPGIACPSGPQGLKAPPVAPAALAAAQRSEEGGAEDGVNSNVGGDEGVQCLGSVPGPGSRTKRRSRTVPVRFTFPEGSAKKPKVVKGGGSGNKKKKAEAGKGRNAGASGKKKAATANNAKKPLAKKKPSGRKEPAALPAAVAAKGNFTAGGIMPYVPPGCHRVAGRVIDTLGYHVAPYPELKVWQDERIAAMKFDFRANHFDHVTYRSLKDKYGNPYQLMSFNESMFKKPGGICCQFCGVPMQLASLNRHDKCAYFKKKKEIELKLGITDEPTTDTVRFRPDEQDGYTYAAADEPVEENSESDDSVVAGASPGGKEGGADSEEESISKPGEK